MIHLLEANSVINLATPSLSNMLQQTSTMQAVSALSFQYLASSTTSLKSYLSTIY